MRDDLESYSEIKPEFNKCYDKEFNQIFNIVDADEHEILVKDGALEKVKNSIVQTFNTKCEKVNKLIKSEIESIKVTQKSYPTNLDETDFYEVLDNSREIFALEGIVMGFRETENTPNLKLKVGNNYIWILSSIDYDFVKKEDRIKVLGYLIPLKNKNFKKSLNQNNFQILGLGIYKIDSKELKFMSGSESQIMNWKKGEIPE
ncbi:hypothetical protein [Psychroflexus aestuariivivens]|uniref:hypothetical protein n=1 Tax=Psychroflexus aestuariivivens TaxID=1795040 RepID=UPI000FD7E91D|nr:hypothetical protein [Psychroflexus aestuariivivens]